MQSEINTKKNAQPVMKRSEFGSEISVKTIPQEASLSIRSRLEFDSNSTNSNQPHSIQRKME
jgi:hypothetical protein